MFLRRNEILSPFILSLRFCASLLFFWKRMRGHGKSIFLREGKKRPSALSPISFYAFKHATNVYVFSTSHDLHTLREALTVSPLMQYYMAPPLFPFWNMMPVAIFYLYLCSNTGGDAGTRKSWQKVRLCTRTRRSMYAAQLTSPP